MHTALLSLSSLVLDRLPFVAAPIMLKDLLARQRGAHIRTFLLFTSQTHPVHKDLVTVTTGRCLGVFRRSPTGVVPGGACVLCNLSTIVQMTKWSTGTGCRYVVTQSCLVNDLPCWSYVSLSYSMSWVQERDPGAGKDTYFRRGSVLSDMRAS